MECSAERDQRLMQVVSEALCQPVEQRESYLRLACHNDPDLYSEATDVVKGEETMGSFLLHPAIAFKDSPRPFKIGQVVADRFEITREMGEGGMGVVYEAFDRKLKRRVAIKSAKPGFQPRLSPEIRGALAVSHPNICRVNEIHTGHTETGDVDFLTMELLDGETLSSYLKSRGRLSTQEALEIARQICEGLAEAHRRGIVHRDLKSGNVILCRNEKNETRAVITDFGLAGDGSQTGDLGGTPRYIAPELWKGAKASKASDIYALGVILYEMVAGRRSITEISTMSRIESDVSTASDSDIPGASSGVVLKALPHRWARTISRCLAASPEARPSDAVEVLAALEHRASVKMSLVAMALLLLASFISPQVRTWVHDQLWPPPSVRLVVLPASTPDTSAVVSGGALQDAGDRISHLRSGQRTVAVISPSKAREMQVQTPQQAQRVLHATHALQITVHPDGEDLVIQGSVVDLQTQTHLRDFSARYSPKTLGALAGALAGEVSSALNLRGNRTEAISSAATAPYDRGLYYLRLDVQNVDEAIRSFGDAARLDPRSPLPLAGMVEAEVDKFDDTHSPENLQRAQKYLQMAESLDADSVRVHLASGMFNEATGQYAQAREQYSRVTDLEPRNVYAYIRIAGVYEKESMPDNAITSYHHAIALDPTFYDPHEYFGVFHFNRGRFSEAAQEFQRVIELAPGMYNAYANLGASLEKLGRSAEAEKALRSALSLRETPRALNNMGSLLLTEKRFSEARSYLLKATSLTPNDYVVLLNLADSNRHLGRTEESRSEYQRAMDLALAELAQSPGSGYARAFVAYFAARIGDKKRAKDEIGQALRLSPGDNTVIRLAILTYEALGRRDDALATLSGATEDLLRNLDGDPDLADFCQDLRFRQLVATNSK